MVHLKSIATQLFIILLLAPNLSGQSFKSSLTGINASWQFNLFELENENTIVATTDKLIVLDPDGFIISTREVLWDSRRIIMVQDELFNFYKLDGTGIVVKRYNLNGNIQDSTILSNNDFSLRDVQPCGESDFAVLMYENVDGMQLKKYDNDGNEMYSRILNPSFNVGTKPRSLYSRKDGSFICYDSGHPKNLYILDDTLSITFNGTIQERAPFDLVVSDDDRIFTAGITLESERYLNEIDGQGNILNEIILSDLLTCGESCYPYGLSINENKLGYFTGFVEFLDIASFHCFDFDLNEQFKHTLSLDETNSFDFGQSAFAIPIPNANNSFSFGYARQVGENEIEPVVFRLNTICDFDSTVINDITSSAITPLQEKDDLVITPNPVSNILSITSHKAISKLDLYNIYGQKINLTAFNAPETRQIDVSTLHEGYYFLSYTIDGEIYTKQFIKL